MEFFIFAVIKIFYLQNDQSYIMIWYLTKVMTPWNLIQKIIIPTILLNMPNESYFRRILDNLRAEKELAELLLFSIEVDDCTSDGSELTASDSDLEARSVKRLHI